MMIDYLYESFYYYCIQSVQTLVNHFLSIDSLHKQNNIFFLFGRLLQLFDSLASFPAVRALKMHKVAQIMHNHRKTKEV